MFLSHSFNDDSASKVISFTMKEHIRGPWPTWKHVPDEIRGQWWQSFQVSTFLNDQRCVSKG